MEQLLSLILSLVVAFFPQPAVEVSAPNATEVEMAEVIRVIDGDTIDVRFADGEEVRVRYIGVDTPEPYAKGMPECYASEATLENRRLLEGGEVQLQADAENTDRYGRLLRYVYVGDVFINAELVRGGYATALRIKPNTAEYENLKALERDARKQGVGLWGACL